MGRLPASRFVLFIFLFVLSIGFPAAAAQQRTDTSLAASRLLETMRQITATPYSFDSAGKVLGRTELDQQRWTDLAAQLENLIVNATPSAVDAQVLDELSEQLRDPYAWINSSVLAHALGHIGPRAISELIEIVNSSSDRLVRSRVAELLASTVKRSDPQQVDNQLVDDLSALLDDPDLSMYIASALAGLGARAERALPALERSLNTAEEEERSLGVVLGVLSSDVIRNAIAIIRNRPVP